MKRRITWLAVVALSCACWAQSPAQISGVARSATTGEPVRGAVVSFKPNGAGIASAASTGADGRFQISGLQPGSYQVMVRKSGYEVFRGSAPVVIRDQDRASELVADLWPHGAIAGRIVDGDGEPVAHAAVRAFAVARQIDGVALSVAATSTANDLGEYRLFDLPAGEYVIQAAPPPPGTPAGQFYAGTPVSYYPSAAGPAQALPVKLGWGTELPGVDLAMPGGQSYAIAGQAWDASAGLPCTPCTVQAIQQDGNYRVTLPQAARPGPDGSFVLRGLPAGDYTLVVRQGGGGGAVGQAPAVLRKESIAGVVLLVGEQRPVSGEVVLDGPPAAVVREGWTIALSPVNLPVWWPSPVGAVEADGSFTVPDVPPGRYRFSVAGTPVGAYVKSVDAGGRLLASPEITISGQSSLSGLRAVIAFDGAALSGEVRTPEGSPVEVRVFLIPLDKPADSQRFRTASAAPDGSFAFASLPPGAYAVYAVPRDSNTQVFDPATRAALERFAGKVTLAPNQSASLRVSPAR